MFREHESVVLTHDLPEFGLKAGDVGTIVMVHAAGGYEIEFMALDGETIAVTSLSTDEMRPIARREIAHARGEWLASRGTAPNAILAEAAPGYLTGIV